MGLFNRWTSKKELDEARGKRDASIIKKVVENKEEVAQPKAPKASIKEAKKSVKVETESVAADSNREIKFTEGHKVLLRPIVTEKSTYLHSGGVYAFEVGVLATKPEIKKAVESIYKVKVVQVRVINLQGKRVRF